MSLTKWMPKPLRKFVRKRMTIFVYTYGFRPSPVIQEQMLRFSVSGRTLTVKADHRTALYDMIVEVVDYDAYQLRKLRWDGSEEHHIIDIGANVGVTALVLSQVPRARLTCYEPDPGNCRFLRENLALNGIDNVAIVQSAVSSVNGSVEFEADEESTGGRVLEKGPTAKGARIKVQAVTLEKAVEQCGSPAVGLLKIDCEGGEYNIVEQMTQELADRIQNIALEVHDLDENRNLQRISERLQDLGYQLSTKPDMWGRSALHLLLAQKSR